MRNLLNFLILVCGFCAACFLGSCNVTRRVTTESSYIQKGDTACTITVKTVETYDARKNLNY